MLLREEDVEMRTEFDLSPLFRSTVGFDRMFDLLRHSTRGGVDEHHNYPPYDIERTGEDSYRVTLAVAGFRPEELTVTAQQNLLLVTGDKRAGSGGGEQQRQVLYRGIAGRAFERRFELADHVKVVGANLADGLLTIELRREVPEAMRPRRIEIGGANGGNVLRGPRPQQQVEGDRAA
jgi:molecular chaperone IbpA